MGCDNLESSYVKGKLRFKAIFHAGCWGRKALIDHLLQWRLFLQLQDRALHHVPELDRARKACSTGQVFCAARQASIDNAQCSVTTKTYLDGHVLWAVFECVFDQVSRQYGKGIRIDALKRRVIRERQFNATDSIGKSAELAYN